MNEVINVLQTLAICLTLMLTVFTLGWIVYAFRKIVILFNGLVDEFEKPRVFAQTTQTTTTTALTETKADYAYESVPAPEPEIKRYPCHRCKARLPEQPTHSRIEGEVTLLVYRCKRCGKETEVDPSKTQPVS